MFVCERQKYSVIESTLFLELPCEIHCVCIWEREPIYGLPGVQTAVILPTSHIQAAIQAGD